MKGIMNEIQNGEEEDNGHEDDDFLWGEPGAASWSKAEAYLAQARESQRREGAGYDSNCADYWVYAKNKGYYWSLTKNQPYSSVGLSFSQPPKAAYKAAVDQIVQSRNIDGYYFDLSLNLAVVFGVGVDMRYASAEGGMAGNLKARILHYPNQGVPGLTIQVGLGVHAGVTQRYKDKKENPEWCIWGPNLYGANCRTMWKTLMNVYCCTIDVVDGSNNCR